MFKLISSQGRYNRCNIQSEAATGEFLGRKERHISSFVNFEKAHNRVPTTLKRP